MTKTIQHNGQTLTVEEARRLIEELEMLLVEADPMTGDYPFGKPVRALLDPRWYSAPTPMADGVLLAFRSPSVGWQGFMLPWPSVEQMAELFIRQIENREEEPVPVTGMTH